MILYARYLSPFGRRVAVWLGLQGVAFEQVALAPMENFEDLLAKNPVGRAPALELPDGTVLVDSTMICDHLEAIAPPERRLLPSDPVARLAVTQTMAHAHGVSEKAVAYVYEAMRRPEPLQWDDWKARLIRQIEGGLAEMERRTPADGFFGGERPNGADVVSVIAHDMIGLARPDLLGEKTPKLATLSARANALEPFASTPPKMA
ncbi:MAG: glutathione S-transferase family protein [Pseudomonadota bacterium]